MNARNITVTEITDTETLARFADHEIRNEKVFTVSGKRVSGTVAARISLSDTGAPKTNGSRKIDENLSFPSVWIALSPRAEHANGEIIAQPADALSINGRVYGGSLSPRMLAVEFLPFGSHYIATRERAEKSGAPILENVLGTDGKRYSGTLSVDFMSSYSDFTRAAHETMTEIARLVALEILSEEARERVVFGSVANGYSRAESAVADAQKNLKAAGARVDALTSALEIFNPEA